MGRSAIESASSWGAVNVWGVRGENTRWAPVCRLVVAATDSDIDAQDLVLPDPIRAGGNLRGLFFRFLIPRAQPIHPLEQGNKLREISYFMWGGVVPRRPIGRIELKGPIVALEVCLTCRNP